jgi:hypothetical protein
MGKSTNKGLEILLCLLERYIQLKFNTRIGRFNLRSIEARSTTLHESEHCIHELHITGVLLKHCHESFIVFGTVRHPTFLEYRRANSGPGHRTVVWFIIFSRMSKSPRRRRGGSRSPQHTRRKSRNDSRSPRNRSRNDSRSPARKRRSRSRSRSRDRHRNRSPPNRSRSVSESLVDAIQQPE